MKKNEKKVIFGTIPATAKNEAAKQTEAVAAEQTTAETPATQTEAAEAKPEPEAPATVPAPAEETPFEEMFPDAPKMQAETVLKLSRRIEELEQQLRQEPQTIEERIAYYKRKQALTERYEHFIAQVEHLDELRAQVDDMNEVADDFSDTREKYRLQIFAPHLYQDKSVLSITNAVLIDSVLALLRERMLNRAAELKAEISA